MRLTTPEYDEAESWVSHHLADLTIDGGGRSRLRGGQAEADRRLAALDITGYASTRNEVHPRHRRGATGLSPWIRHGLLTLPRVWQAVAESPSRDRSKFRDELLWQEYARHWYARLGGRTRHGVRSELAVTGAPSWEAGLGCIDTVLDELHADGWLVNQTRMWLASHWSVRAGAEWREGEEHFFRHLLDGSRAANRLGWQWTTGVGSSKPYGFIRWQVEKRAPGLCDGCALRHDCPIEDWPDDRAAVAVEAPAALRRAADIQAESGPDGVTVVDGTPDAVWLTAESLGDDDPALAAHPEVPVVFVFDEPLLRQLRLSAKRLVFLTECLADLATHRTVEVRLGDPIEELSGQRLATTFAPVPGWRRRADAIGPAVVHPWPWLSRPAGGSVQSFSAWRKSQRV